MAILLVLDDSKAVAVLNLIIVLILIVFDDILDPHRGLLSSINIPLGDPHVRSGGASFRFGK